jgi:hypothetical protein
MVSVALCRMCAASVLQLHCNLTQGSRDGRGKLEGGVSRFIKAEDVYEGRTGITKSTIGEMWNRDSIATRIATESQNPDIVCDIRSRSRLNP